MQQKDFVIAAMRRNGGYATLQQLYQTVDTSSWTTKTPQESIRRLVQQHGEFFKIRPGLWALRECERAVLRKFNIENRNARSNTEFTHSYFQGLIVGIGNIKRLATYVPPQDKNRLFLETPLGELATVHDLRADNYRFTYDALLRKAATVDAIWFNQRKMPCAFYEVEHTTDIQHSVNKFYELQDFRASFCIVAAEHRRPQFEDVMAASIYDDIRGLVRFASYDAVARQYGQASNTAEVI